MNAELGLCTSEPFMQAFTKLETSEGSYFGPEFPDFDKSEIEGIKTPKQLKGNVFCYQADPDGYEHGCRFAVFKDDSIELLRCNRGDYHGRHLTIQKSGQVTIKQFKKDK